MAIKYDDIKEQLVDLGFETDSDVADEYDRVRLNAINRSLDVIWSTIIVPYKTYFINTDEIDEDATGLVHFKLDGSRTTSNLPSILTPLLPLLSAHWLWLDDDLTKATLYWNEYDDLKTQIISVIAMPKNASIEGGF